MTPTPEPSRSRLLHNVLLFARMLREAGLPIAPTQGAELAAALEHLDIARRDHVFCAARALLVQRADDLALFEQIFDRFWRRASVADPAGAANQAVAPPRQERIERRFMIVESGLAGAAAEYPEVETSDRSGTFSDREALREREFSELTADELARLGELMRTTDWRMTERRTRRWVATRRGNRLDLRKAMRQAGRLDGHILSLPRLRRKIKPRPLVLLADISGSMERYTRVLLQFLYCMSHSFGEVESFVFGTRLSRITPALALRNVDRALEHAASEVDDWASGTRIGESLQTFNRRWGRRVLRRGAVVIVASDGWERGDVGDLRRAMQHLQRRCHRLIWLNPLLGHADYRPLVEGMAAALPYVDDFLPVHNLAALDRLAQHLEKLPARRGGVRAGRAGAAVPEPMRNDA